MIESLLDELDDRTFIIEDAEHAIEIYTYDSPYTDDKRSYYISTNFREIVSKGSYSIGLSELMAQQLSIALNAVLSGKYDRAISLISLRVGKEKQERDDRILLESKREVESEKESARNLLEELGLLKKEQPLIRRRL